MASSTQTTDVTKKDLLTRRVPSGLYFEFYYEGGGEVPAFLKGLYTSKTFAEAAKRAYLFMRDGAPVESVEPESKEEVQEVQEEKKPQRKYSGKPVKA